MTAAATLRVALAAGLLLLALAIVGVLRLGPVVAVLTETHGVHAGDPLAAVPGLAGLWLLGVPERLRRLHLAGPARRGSIATA